MHTVRELPILLPTRLLSRFLDISIGAGKGRVPWKKIQQSQGDYIKAKYLPKGVILTQYYHLRQEDVNAILEHWTRRQAAGKVPFRFRKVAKAIRQQERNSEENDAGAGMGPGEEAEEDPQGNDDSPGNAAENPSWVGCLLKNGDCRR